MKSTQYLDAVLYVPMLPPSGAPGPLTVLTALFHYAANHPLFTKPNRFLRSDSHSM